MAKELPANYRTSDLYLIVHKAFFVSVIFSCANFYVAYCLEIVIVHFSCLCLFSAMEFLFSATIYCIVLCFKLQRWRS